MRFRRGRKCSVEGCFKRVYSYGNHGPRSDSEGSSDEESAMKRKVQRSFHRFPLGVKERQKWLVNIKRPHWTPKLWDVVCSDHFLEKNIDRRHSHSQLKPGALPTRFKKYVIPNIQKVKRGKECCVIGCFKQRPYPGHDGRRSDSEGSSDEESAVKRQHRRHFLRFPSDPKQRKRWLICLNRPNWTPSKSDIICSDHFSEQCLDRLGKRIKFRRQALPTRFKNSPRPNMNKQLRRPTSQRLDDWIKFCQDYVNDDFKTNDDQVPFKVGNEDFIDTADPSNTHENPSATNANVLPQEIEVDSETVEPLVADKVNLDADANTADVFNNRMSFKVEDVDYTDTAWPSNIYENSYIATVLPQGFEMDREAVEQRSERNIDVDTAGQAAIIQSKSGIFTVNPLREMRVNSVTDGEPFAVKLSHRRENKFTKMKRQLKMERRRCNELTRKVVSLKAVIKELRRSKGVKIIINSNGIAKVNDGDKN
eukprot:gene12964-14297_t